MTDHDHTHDRAEAIQWARQRTTQRLNNYVILDTETTGLEAGYAEVIQVGVIDMQGRTLLDALVYPTRDIDPGAAAVHGLSRGDLRQAAPFPAVYPALAAVLARSRVLVYNASFDRGILQAQCSEHRLPSLPGCDPYIPPLPEGDAAGRYLIDLDRWECVMLRYAAFCGEYDDYHGDYRWQKLPGAAHAAIADCRAVLALMQRMAAADDETARGTVGVRP